MTKKVKDTPVIFLSVESPSGRDGFFHVRAHIARLVDDREEDEWHRAQGVEFISPDFIKGMYVSRSIIFSSQGDRHYARLYAQELRLEGAGSSRTTDEVVRLARTMSLIGKRMKKHAEEHYMPQNPTTMFFRFANAVGAKRVYFRPIDTPDGSYRSKQEVDFKPLHEGGLEAIRQVVTYALDRYGAKFEDEKEVA